MSKAGKGNLIPDSSHLGITELRSGIHQFRGEKPGSHTYLIQGWDKNVLIDTGVNNSFPNLTRCLTDLGLEAGDIHLVILTHEHFDHIGAAAFFCETAIIAAHRLAANKIELQDEFVTLSRYRDASSRPFYAQLWLEDATFFALGNYELKVIHTPGHTSGCICIYEPNERLLFSGDTVFANGTLSDIYTSGNISDYVNSMRRLRSLKIDELYPGHGRISYNPEQDMKQAMRHARKMMHDTKILFEAINSRRSADTPHFPHQGTKDNAPKSPAD